MPLTEVLGEVAMFKRKDFWRIFHMAWDDFSILCIQNGVMFSLFHAFFLFTTFPFAKPAIRQWFLPCSLIYLKASSWNVFHWCLWEIHFWPSGHDCLPSPIGSGSHPLPAVPAEGVWASQGEKAAVNIVVSIAYSLKLPWLSKIQKSWK